MKDQEIDEFIPDKTELEEHEIIEIPRQFEFYKVPSRFGSIPVDELPLGCDRERQYKKLFPIVRLPFQRVERVSLGHTGLEPNHIIWGDNLHVMRMLPSNSIDLIYIDPPFFSGRQYNVIFGDQNEVRSFADIWEGGMPSYLVWLNARILEMKRLLRPTGSIFVHLDWHAAHYVKVELDKIFGYDNFLNEITWKYESGGRSKAKLSSKHDVILWYAKTGDYKYVPDAISKPRDEVRHHHMKKNVDSEGRVFYTIKSAGKIYKYYADELVPPSDVWDDISHLQQKDPERIGYPTQKPEKLIERVILMASDANDLVADFFCGGGTTPTVAQKLGRRWIACDQSRIAVAVTRDRLLRAAKGDSSKKSIQQSLSPIGDISLEYWGIYEVPALTKLTEDEFRRFVVSAFDGQVTSGDEFIHGYKGRTPLYVGPASQEAQITKREVIEFARHIRTRRGKNDGTMLAWGFAPSSREAADKLASESLNVDFVKIQLIPLESKQFREHVTSKHKEYERFLTFVLPPEVRVKVKRSGPFRYEFDVSESISLNLSGKIMNVQWDFDFKDSFASTKGYSFVRNDTNEPSLKMSYTFGNAGTRKVACRVQDDLGGEKTEVLEVEVH